MAKNARSAPRNKGRRAGANTAAAATKRLGGTKAAAKAVEAARARNAGRGLPSRKGRAGALVRSVQNAGGVKSRRKKG